MSCRSFALRRHALRPRAGFTLVELLVVISIIGMLMALLLPAVQQAREAGRRNTCSNNMRQAALAVTNFVSSKGVYPGYVEALPLASTGGASGSVSDVVYPVSWVVPILPYMERTDVYNLWRNQTGWANSGIVGWSAATYPGDPPPVYMDVLNCPSSPPLSKQSNTPCAYVANSGMWDALSSAGGAAAGGGATPASSGDLQANGIFFNHFNPAQTTLSGQTVTTPTGSKAVAIAVSNLGPMVSISQDYITVHDGSSLTLMLSENNTAPMASVASGVVSGAASSTGGSGFWGTNASGVPFMAGTEPQNCFVWWADAMPDASMKINAPQSAIANYKGTGNVYNFFMHPASNHPTGVNVSFCDGHTRFISQDIDYNVFCLLMTPWGQQCNTPGPAANAGNYYPSGTSNLTLVKNKPIDEADIN